MNHSHKYHDDEWLTQLAAPVKNRFFYGMLLTEHVFRKEQRYFDAKRWLLNRLTLGKGVLAGLDFTIKELTVNEKKCWGVELTEGVAVDGYGRELVAPKEPHDRQLPLAAVVLENDHETTVYASDVVNFLTKLGIDPKTPSVPPLPLLELQVGYADHSTDPAPVKAGHCATECEPSKTREVLRVRVVKCDADPRLPADDDDHEIGDPHSTAVGQEWNRQNEDWIETSDDGEVIRIGNLPTVFPPEPLEAVQHRDAAQKHKALIEPVTPLKPDGSEKPEDHPAWVTLGLVQLTVTVDAGKPALKFERLANSHRYYRQIFSNDALSKLIFGMADRVDEATRVRTLVYNGTGEACGEAQEGDVYQVLAKPLKVKVVNSLGQAPADVKSIKVRFEVQSHTDDRLIVVALGADAPTTPKTQWAADTTPATVVAVAPGEAPQPAPPAPVISRSTGRLGKIVVDVTIQTDGALAEDVYWQLSGEQGLHTVSARIIAVGDDGNKSVDPAFQPGSSLVFHATAQPTAPTIVGMRFLEETLWTHDPTCPGRLKWGTRHPAKLRFYTSRRMANIETIQDAFIVWRIVRHHEHGCLLPLEFYSLNYIPNSLRPVNHYFDHPAEDIWQADFAVTRTDNNGTHQLVDGLTTADILRLVVLGRVVVADASPHTSGTTNYPVAQVLDVDFAGSYLSQTYRDSLWNEIPYLPEEATLGTFFEQTQAPNYRFTPEDHAYIESHVGHFWDRFQPRECCLPTGNGDEGGEFHKTFEFRLPHC